MAAWQAMMAVSSKSSHVKGCKKRDQFDMSQTLKVSCRSVERFGRPLIDYTRASPARRASYADKVHVTVTTYHSPGNNPQHSLFLILLTPHLLSIQA